jgi:nitrite reductase/ring-hydroxylating ferredoxin subunit
MTCEPTTSRVLCRLDDIPDGGSAGFSMAATDGDEPLELMAIRRGNSVFCYVNSCPHWGSPLDLVPGRFLARDGRHILCTTHGALFRIDDGRCIKGPCLGAALRPVPCRVEDGRVLAAVPAPQVGAAPVR